MKTTGLFSQYPWLRHFLLAFLLVVPILFNQGCILALEPMTGAVQPELPTKITFAEGLNSYTFPLGDFGLEITYNWEGDIFSGYQLLCRDEKRLKKGISELARLIDRPATEAGFRLDEQGQMCVVPGSEGRRLDQDVLYRSMFNGSPYLSAYSLLVHRLKPELSEDWLQDKKPDTLWAEYSTMLTNIPNRTENIRLASSLLNGTILGPGQEFSFNGQIGPREKERGFREAKVIVDGSFEPGLGGGVCQVSSTLYNAVLLAGLEITERHNHSVRIAYVPIGRDATVLYGSKDFKFRNNTPGYIMIRTKLTGLKLEMYIHGRGSLPYDQVELTSKIIKTIPANVRTYLDSQLPSGARKLLEKGQSGYVSETYRRLTAGPQVIQELLSRDYYAPQPHLYAVGVSS